MSQRARSVSALRRLALTWPCALVLSLGTGCATPGANTSHTARPQLDQNSSPAEVRRGAESWLERRALAHRDRALTVLPRSYPGAHGALARRHYLYDAALVLIWASWTERDGVADEIAAELVELQRDDGRWPDALEIDGGSVDASSLHPAGVTAWVAYALAYYHDTYGAPRASRSARRAAEHLMQTRMSGPDGCGRLVRSRIETAPIAVTEHQLDTLQLLAALDQDHRAAELLDETLACLWLDDERRFATAARPDGIETAPALDAAGGWGALALRAMGRPRLADASLGYTVTTFALHDGAPHGFRPSLEIPENADGEDLLFYEGSLGVALAGLRLNRRDMARETISTALQAAIEHDGGVPYASFQAPGFSNEPAVSSTTWFLLAEREMHLGVRAPVFTAELDTGTPDTSSTTLDTP